MMKKIYRMSIVKSVHFCYTDSKLQNCKLAEGVGFEPTRPIKGHGSPGRPIKPLSHPSIKKIFNAEEVKLFFSKKCVGLKIYNLKALK